MKSQFYLLVIGVLSLLFGLSVVSSAQDSYSVRFTGVLVGKIQAEDCIDTQRVWSGWVEAPIRESESQPNKSVYFVAAANQARDDNYCRSFDECQEKRNDLISQSDMRMRIVETSDVNTGERTLKAYYGLGQIMRELTISCPNGMGGFLDQSFSLPYEFGGFFAGTFALNMVPAEGGFEFKDFTRKEEGGKAYLRAMLTGSHETDNGPISIVAYLDILDEDNNKAMLEADVTGTFFKQVDLEIEYTAKVEWEIPGENIERAEFILNGTTYHADEIKGDSAKKKLNVKADNFMAGQGGGGNQLRVVLYGDRNSKTEVTVEPKVVDYPDYYDATQVAALKEGKVVRYRAVALGLLESALGVTVDGQTQATLTQMTPVYGGLWGFQPHIGLAKSLLPLNVTSDGKETKVEPEKDITFLDYETARMEGKPQRLFHSRAWFTGAFTLTPDRGLETNVRETDAAFFFQNNPWKTKESIARLFSDNLSVFQWDTEISQAVVDEVRLEVAISVDNEVPIHVIPGLRSMGAEYTLASYPPFMTVKDFTSKSEETLRSEPLGVNVDDLVLQKISVLGEGNIHASKEKGVTTEGYVNAFSLISVGSLGYEIRGFHSLHSGKSREEETSEVQGRSFSLTQEIVASSVIEDASPDIAVGPDGLHAVVWSEIRMKGGDSIRTIKVQFLKDGSVDGEPMDLNVVNKYNHHPEAIFTEDGDLIVVWETSDAPLPTTLQEGFDFIPTISLSFARIVPTFRSGTLGSGAPVLGTGRVRPRLEKSDDGSIWLFWRKLSGSSLVGNSEDPVSIERLKWQGPVSYWKKNDGTVESEVVVSSITDLVDWEPALGTGDAAAVALVRYEGDPTSLNSDVWLAERDGNGWQEPTLLTKPNVRDASPLLAYTNDNRPYLLWHSDTNLSGYFDGKTQTVEMESSIGRERLDGGSLLAGKDAFLLLWPQFDHIGWQTMRIDNPFIVEDHGGVDTVDADVYSELSEAIASLSGDDVVYTTSHHIGVPGEGELTTDILAGTLRPEGVTLSVESSEYDEKKGALNLSITPNPISHEAEISLDVDQSQHLTISISSLLGEPVLTLEERWFNTGRYSFNISAKTLSTGTYYLHAHDANGVAHDVVKFIVE